MEYITHHQFKQKGACGQEMNIPIGTKVNIIGGFIATNDGKAICRPKSQAADMHFAVNDDGKGLERGNISYAIAFSDRKRKCEYGEYRFDDKEQEILCNKWSKYLVPNIPVILFNNAFFHADIETLKQIAKDLRITVKE